MTAQTNDAVAAMCRKLGRLAPLDDTDRQAIASLPINLKNVRAGDYVMREGTVASDCSLLVEGYACRHKITETGARQIVSFHLRGDILDLHHLFFEVADHNVQLLTEATVASFPAKALKDVARERPAIADALARDMLIDSSIFREWVVNVGRRDARARICHMLCEIVSRGAAVGLGSAERFQLPMTQEQIADATGLTPVHVNRTLRALEHEGVIERTGREVRIGNWSLIRRIAGFDPAYLHAAA